jgi:hypothetical protein
VTGEAGSVPRTSAIRMAAADRQAKSGDAAGWEAG